MTSDQVRRRAHSAPFLENWSGRINWSRSSLSVESDTSSLSSDDSDSQNGETTMFRLSRLRKSHRRGLLILFLIALYTTFGLRAPVVSHYQHYHPHPPPSARKAEESSTNHDKPRPHVLRATHTDSRLALARRTAERPSFQKKTELSAFYQQRAFHSNPFDVGFYVNCAALMGIALWAAVEQRHRQHHVR